MQSQLIRESRKSICAEFLSILPFINAQCEREFRQWKAEMKMEMVAEATAIAWKSFCGIEETGRDPVRLKSRIVAYAIQHVRAGRTLASRWSSVDAMSRRAQLRHGFSVHRSANSRHSGRTAGRISFSVEEIGDRRHRNVSQEAAFRIDFNDWLSRLDDRLRDIVSDLASGYSTSEVSNRFGLSAGRISQIRRELENSWKRFHEGESECRPGIRPDRPRICRRTAACQSAPR